MGGLGWTFDSVAAEYDRWRPGYPAELYADIFAYRPLGGESEVLEVGLGSGQASGPILETGCRLTAVEPGEHLAEIARGKFAAGGRFSVRTARFEDCPLPASRFDLVYSASAFHWVPEEIGYAKVFSLLKPGGAFARFANHPYPDKKEQGQLDADIQKLYQTFMPGSRPGPQYTEEMARARAQIAAKYGFADIEYRLYHRTFVYTADDYVKRLAVQSDKIALTADAREGLLAGIRAAVAAHGGTITIHDTLDLQLARRKG